MDWSHLIVLDKENGSLYVKQPTALTPAYQLSKRLKQGPSHCFQEKYKQSCIVRNCLRRTITIRGEQPYLTSRASRRKSIRGKADLRVGREVYTITTAYMSNWWVGAASRWVAQSKRIPNIQFSLSLGTGSLSSVLVVSPESGAAYTRQAK
jgi:hypothetical protein